MKKRAFSIVERQAIWLCHEKRCWLCLEPLRLSETTIDHVLPETLLDQPERWSEIRMEWGLPESFNINGFENWLPCHQHCNQSKGASTFQFTPAQSLLVGRLLKLAPDVQRRANRIVEDAKKDKILGMILAALENQTVTLDDLQMFALQPLIEAELIRLDNGYWLHKRDVARECDCQCERDRCVGNDRKVHCYFSSGLSEWVIEAGLYWKCYDEEVTCPRCARVHKRGHIGRLGICGICKEKA